MTPEMFGPYRLEELLGRGGMGEVWRAYDTRRERTVALKRLTSGWADDPLFQRRFRLEARATASLNSEHIIVIHDYGEIDGRLFIDMRLMTGGNLADLVAASPRGLPPAQAVDLCAQIADGLDAAHRQKMVHRDVKPSNIMLAPDRGRRRVYLVDFGIVKLADEFSRTGLTATGTVPGTPAYMAPELLDGTAPASAASDIYATGCVLFEMLTGRPVFTGESPWALMYQHRNETPPVPSSLRNDLAPFDAVIARALDKDPAERYPTVEILARAVNDAQAAGTAATLGDPPTSISTRSTVPTTTEPASITATTAQARQTDADSSGGRVSRWSDTVALLLLALVVLSPDYPIWYVFYETWTPLQVLPFVAGLLIAAVRSAGLGNRALGAVVAAATTTLGTTQILAARTPQDWLFRGFLPVLVAMVSLTFALLSRGRPDLLQRSLWTDTAMAATLSAAAMLPFMYSGTYYRPYLLVIKLAVLVAAVGVRYACGRDNMTWTAPLVPGAVVIATEYAIDTHTYWGDEQLLDMIVWGCAVATLGAVSAIGTTLALLQRVRRSSLRRVAS